MGNDPRGYYKLLGVNTDATKAEINKAYNKKQIELHPSGAVRQRMRATPEYKAKTEEQKKALEDELDALAGQVNEAYSVLSDETKRKSYDDGTDSFGEGFSGFSGFSGFQDISDIFNQFTGGSRRSKSNKAKDIVTEIKISYKDVFLGKTSRYEVKVTKICKGCDGFGGKKSSKCSKCNGEGMVLAKMSLGGMFTTTQAVECPDCKGKGFKLSGPVCSDCKGNTVVQDSKILEVNISKGIKSGVKLCYKGQGNEKPKMTPGDIIFAIKVVDDSKYQRIGDDFTCPVEIDILTALTGGVVYFNHPDGRRLAVKVSPFKDLTSSICLPNEGFVGERNGKKGDLYLKPQILINSGLDRSKLSEYIKPMVSKPSGDFVNANSVLKKCPILNQNSRDDAESEQDPFYYRSGINVEDFFGFR